MRKKDSSIYKKNIDNHTKDWIDAFSKKMIWSTSKGRYRWVDKATWLGAEIYGYGFNTLPWQKKFCPRLQKNQQGNLSQNNSDLQWL